MLTVSNDNLSHAFCFSFSFFLFFFFFSFSGQADGMLFSTSLLSSLSYEKSHGETWGAFGGPLALCSVPCALCSVLGSRFSVLVSKLKQLRIILVHVLDPYHHNGAEAECWCHCHHHRHRHGVTRCQFSCCPETDDIIIIIIGWDWDWDWVWGRHIVSFVYVS